MVSKVIATGKHQHINLHKNTSVKSIKPNIPQATLATELHTTKHELISLLDAAGHAMRIINTDFTVRLINRAFSEMTGLKQDDIVGKKCWEVFPSSLCHTPDCRLQRILTEKKTIQIEIERKNSNGTIIQCLVRASQLTDENGQLTGVIEQFRDITQQHLLEKQVMESEERYRALVELGTEVGEAVVMLQDVGGVEGVHTFASDQWSLMTGYSKNELLGMTFLELLHPKDRPSSISRHRQKISGAHIPGLYEMTIIRKDGSELPIELTGAPTTFLGQRANVAYIRNIKRRKEIEQELKIFQLHLIEMVNERTSRLNISNERLKLEILERKRLHEQLRRRQRDLKAQIKSRVQFTRALVHELKTYLTPLLAGSEILEMYAQEEPVKTISRTISSATAGLNTRIDELLDLARGEVGILSITCKWTDLEEVLNEIIGHAKLEAQNNGIRFKVSSNSNLPRLWADEDRLKQIFLNILNNAFKYVNKDGEVMLKTEIKGKNVLIAISDTGHGLSDHQIENVFEPYMVIQEKGRRLSGLGLGLPLAKMFTELHGGHITIRSKLGIGSTFTVHLPIKSICTGR